jgi:hypothetical protein
MKESQSELSPSPSPTDGKGSFLLTTSGEIISMTDHEVRTSLRTTLRALWQSDTGLAFPQPTSDDMTIRKALELGPEDTNAAILYTLKELVNALECKVTMRSATDFDDAMTVITENYGWTLDELRHCFAMIRTGRLGPENLYERFKARELYACMRQYADERARHRMRHAAKYDPDVQDIKPATERTAQSLTAIADVLDLPAYKPKAGILGTDGERHQSEQAAAHQAQSEAKGQEAHPRAGSQEGRPVVQQAGAL